MNNKYTAFKKNCTKVQQEILNMYAEHNYNRIYDDLEYRLCLDGNYTLDDLRIFVKILESKEHCKFLEQFDKDFSPHVDCIDYEVDK